MPFSPAWCRSLLPFYSKRGLFRHNWTLVGGEILHPLCTPWIHQLILPKIYPNLQPHHALPHCACQFLEFVEPASALVPGIMFVRFACNSFFASYRLWNTPANFSTSLIVCDLCFVSRFTPFATSASLFCFYLFIYLFIYLIFFFSLSLQGETDRWCGVRHFSTLLSCFSPSLSKSWHLELSWAPSWLT